MNMEVTIAGVTFKNPVMEADRRDLWVKGRV